MWSFGYLLLPLSLSLSLLVPSIPFPTLVVLGCERTNALQSNFPRHLPTRPKQPSRFRPLCYTANATLPSQDPLVLINLPPIPPTSAFSHFFPTSCQCFITHYDPLHSIALYLPISAPFLPLPSSSDPFATRRSKVGQVTIASPAPRFYPNQPRTYRLEEGRLLTRRAPTTTMIAPENFDFLLLLRDANLYPTP